MWPDTAVSGHERSPRTRHLPFQYESDNGWRRTHLRKCEGQGDRDRRQGSVIHRTGRAARYCLHAQRDNRTLHHVQLNWTSDRTWIAVEAALFSLIVLA